MTTMAPAGEGGGGSGTTAATTTTTTTSSTTTTEQQAPTSSAPTQHPPPSPLSGCYLLVVLPEPHTAQHKDLILNRLAKGFLSWDKDSCHVDLEKELQAIVAQSPEGEEARNGERLIQYATENLVTEVLIYPQSNTLLQCIRNLLASFTKHRHIIHAGYTFGGNGSWILQDGTFSLADFLDAFSEHEVQRVLRAYENSVTVDIHCAGVGDWTTSRLSKEACTRACRVRVNPDDVLTAGVPAITSFTNYIGQYLIAQTLDQLMEPSDVVGNIRFSHPTLYVFPGGQGDAALFGINGFNMLVDGGFARKACFWDFTRHLDRLDAVLVTRINNSNVGGMSSVLKKKKEMHVYPQIGHFFCNLVERRHANSPDGDKDMDPLILNLIDIGQEMMVNLRHINLRPHPCYRDPEPINLYHKVGHGTLDMYVLSPSKDSREVREFLTKWNASDSKLFAGSHRKDSNGILFPAQNLVSICALLVWQPANPEDTITRILFPGSTPQHKIFEGFERLKHLEFLKHPTCTAKSLSPSTSLMTLKDKAAILKPKLSSIERETKRLAEIRREKRDASEIKAVKKDPADDTSTKISTGKSSVPPQIKTEMKARKVVENKKIESEAKESKKIEKELKETKKEVKKVEKSEQPESDAKKTDAVKVETEKTAPVKEPKTQKIDVKKRDAKEISKTNVKPSKPESITKPSTKPVEKKPKSSGEKKDIMKPSPTTPKKSMNGAATKTEMSKPVVKSVVKTSSKISNAPPAKSAKDANNRMVVEQKNIESAAASAATKAPAKPKAIERKPISRRTKPLSPSKARLPISPAKSTRSTPTTSVKSEKDAVIRKIKGGTTDSSAVSTPSGIESESAIKLIDKNLTEKSEDISLDSIESKVLADLKEEREVVEEIEAVLQKAERIEEARKEERFEGDDEITAEAMDKKEEDMTEEDVTAEMDDAPKKLSRKESQELTEEDEYLIVEKEEIYTEDSVQSGDAEQKHHLDEAESEKSKIKIGKEAEEEEVEAEEEQEEEKEEAEEKKDEVPEKSLVATITEADKRKSVDLSPEHKELLKEEMKQIIASAAEVVQKTEEKDDSGKKDSEDITKDPSSLSPDKLDSSVKPDIDQKEVVPEKLEESQERISTLESGATTTAPTLPEDERIPLDEIKEDVDEKHVLEEVKEKEIPVKEKEVIPEVTPAAPKPEVKVLDVKPPVHHGIARDVVKTPDEVADLPVHEEVDPKLYRMDELEKEKETKAAAATQETKEPLPAVAPVKEQKDKGVFSFFGKVADKFEKGIDKLTKKARRDSTDKEAEDKSSKSSSPKEPKPQEKAIFEDVDIDKVFPKVGKHEEKVEPFEQVQPQISDIKTAAITETSTFLQKEKDSIVTTAVPSTDHMMDQTKEEKMEEKSIEDIEEVEALVEEASKKFKNVKDSLQDSLESLEDKADEAKKTVTASADIAKDTLIEAVEKLVDTKSDISDIIESKEPEKVKFIIPSSDDTEKDDDDSDGIVRDFKEAVRDVAEVLVGTAGIELEKEEKPKDVEQIVKKVAEVLKDDDFLTEKTLFADKDKEKDESPKSSVEQAMVPKKVGVTEEVALHEEVEEIPEVEATKRLSKDYQKADKFEVHEELCSKLYKDKDESLIPAIKDSATDKEDAKRICEDLLKDDILVNPVVEVETELKTDVMDLGLEEICIKKVCKRELYDEESEDEKIVVEPEIGFQQKLSPGKAELVTVTPGSTPTSPKLPIDMELPELPAEYKAIFNKETSLENLIEEFIVVKKHKITIQVIQYIVIVKRVPKEKVINIIQETIIKHKIPRDSVADSVQVLRLHDISSEKRLEIENYIINEYLNKNKKITFDAIEDISMKKIIPKCVVIEIVEEIIVNKQISRESVFNIPEKSYFTILREIDDTTEDSTDIDNKDDDKVVESGFVDISPKDAAEAFIQEERKKSHDEIKIIDGSKIIEEEHKVSDVTSIPTTEKSDAQKVQDVGELSEHISKVVEDNEKFVKDTPEKSPKEVSEDESKEVTSAKLEPMQDREISEVSEVDTNEKYLDEAKEKITDEKEYEAQVDILGKSHADATGRSVDVVNVTEIEKTENVDQLQEPKKESNDGRVKRMVVTASSEDGGHEIEICPTGTITFTKSPTLDDSLKEVDVKSSEKDSLVLDKNLLTDSTLEKDTLLSDKPDHKDDKFISEDSLEKFSDIATEIVDFKSSEKAPELDVMKSIRAADQISSIISSTEVAEMPDSLHSGDASPVESIFAKSPTEKIFTEATEIFSHENIIANQVIDDLSAIAEKSKSPSIEKESTIDISVLKTDAKSKSPSPAKEIEEKDIPSDASTELKTVDRSKSPSTEKEVTQKEMSSDIKADNRSKSPSSERETEKKDSVSVESIEAKVHDRSKSPSVEKEISEKEKSPELKTNVDADEKSKSSSPEKELFKKETSQELENITDNEKTKSLSVEKETTTKEKLTELETNEMAVDRSKSPSSEKEVYTKEDSQESEEIKSVDRSKSPSIEKNIKIEVAADIKIDSRSKSPSIEKDITKEKTPEAGERSKSVSLEKEIELKEAPYITGEVNIDDKSKSPILEKDIVDKDMKIEVKGDDRSKSPSLEKDIKKEMSPELEAKAKLDERSKSPSVEKESSRKESLSIPDAQTDDKSKISSDEKEESSPISDTKADRSKSFSVEKETDKKEITPELVSDTKADDISKSPSIEKDIDNIEALSKKAISITANKDETKSLTPNKDHIEKEKSLEILADDNSPQKSKSPSPEKDMSTKEVSPSSEKKISELTSEADVKDESNLLCIEKEVIKKESLHEMSQDFKVDDRSKSTTDQENAAKEDMSPEVTGLIDVIDQSKSPDVEKETHKKEMSPELSTDAKVDGRSKSPSVEKDVAEKEASLELKKDSKTDNQCKPPSIDKNIEESIVSPKQTADDIMQDKSKSPSPEKDIVKKESSPELSVDDNVHSKSKSPSLEKDEFKQEASLEATVDTETKDRLKSPSVEKDTDEKETSSVFISDVKVDDQFKSSSVEPDQIKKDKIAEETADLKSIDKSKSPSPDKDTVQKEVSLTSALYSKIEDKKNESGLEKDDVKKEMSPGPLADDKPEDKSKSLSVEKEINKKEMSPEIITDTKVDDKSKLPSDEKDSYKKDIPSQTTVDKKIDDKPNSSSIEKDDNTYIPSEVTADENDDDRSKSPSFEKDITEKEIPSELGDAKVDGKSKSPSVEKDVKNKLISPEVNISKDDNKSKSSSPEKDEGLSPELTADTKIEDRSKSPSVEKDLDKKDIPSEMDSAETKMDSKSRSPSIEKDTGMRHKRDTSSEGTVDVTTDNESKLLDVEKATTKETLSELAIDTKLDDRSKSPSIEKDAEKQDGLSDITIDIKTDHRSKSSSVEKDIEIDDKLKSPNAGKETENKEKSSELLTDFKADDKSKSPTIEKDSKVKESSPEKLSDVLHMDEKRSPSIEKDTIKTEMSSPIVEDTKSMDRSKSPSPKKEETESRSSVVGDKIDDLLDRKESISFESDKLEGTALQRVSISDDKTQKSRSPSISGDIKSEAHDLEKSKSVSPVSEKTKIDVSLHDTADDRKSSIASIESHPEEKGKDRSRSHSLFESGDKTPVIRSRAASLYEDKIVEKVNLLEQTKDTLGQTHGIFEETEELRLSHESIDQLHIADSKEELKQEQHITSEIRKSIVDYIFSEYINKKKLITLSTIQEISVIYKIDQDVIIRIINEIIYEQNIKRETFVDFDDKEYEETNQKLLDDEEGLTDYINDEFIAKKKKIDSKTVDSIASAKSVSRHLVILVIENIITSSSRRRESIVDFDFPENHDFPQNEKSQASATPASNEDISSRKKSLSDSLKLSVDTKSTSPSPEPEPSLMYKSDRPDPHIDEEITISENKRIEVESLLIDEYVTRGIKITEPILELIVVKTSLPKYIIIEIIEEISIKKHLSKDAIADKLIFHDDDDSQHKLEYEHGVATTEIGEHKSSGCSTPDTRSYEVGLEKSGQYADYESPFHKAFMGGMTEIRTTHITTLSGKSTPDFGQRTETPESISETTDNVKVTITNVPGQFESTSGVDSHQTSSGSQSKTEETIRETTETTKEIHSQVMSGETLVVLKTTQIITYPEETTEITKEFITHESKPDDDPTKKIIEQDQPDTITKIIKHDPIITTRTSISGDDYNQEFITTETIKTITSEKEIDPVSLFVTPGATDVHKGVEHTETSSVSDSKTADHTETSSMSDSKTADKPSTVPLTSINVEEKLISLESQPNDTSKTSISSQSSHDSKVESTIMHEEKHTTTLSPKDLMDHTIPEQMEQSAFPLIRDLITDDKSYSGKSSPDVSLPKDIVYGGSTGKSTPEISMSPLIRDGSMIQSHLQSGRSTPDRRSDRGSRTATPEGFRSGDVIRTIITTTRTMSDDGEIITTTQEVTEATNEKGETIVLAEKTDVKVDERLPEEKPIDIQRAPSASSDKEIDPTSPRSDLSSGHSRAATHMWGSSDERHTYSDEDQPSPPLSSSPYHTDSAVKEGAFKASDDFSSAAMSSSFYGELPEESIHFHSSTLSKTVEQVLPGESDEFSFKKFTVEKEFTGGHSDKDSKKYVDEADLDFEKALTGEKSDRVQGSSVLGAGSFSQELEKSSHQSKSGPADDKKDPLAGWGSPLGLPSPKAPRKFNLRSPIQPCSSADLSPDSLNFDVINDWGEPMRLPSPAPTANEVSNKGSPGTPKKEKKQMKKVLSENIKNQKRSESPSKNDKRMKDSKNKVQPIYVDLTYVSHHGNSFYTALEFFKKVRARYYVFSGTEPSREVYDALLEAKKTWEDKDLEVTMIPTYDTDTLGYWVADNEEALAAHHIDLSPSASRCTINLQDHETSCSAYRLEF